jgi:membrane protein required for colicin V production
MNVSAMDVVFILLIAVFMIRCFLKGFISEILSMAAIVLGLMASLFFYKNGAEYLRENVWPGLEVIPEIIAFIALFLIVFILIKILETMLKGIIQGIRLGGADKFLGLVFGFAEGIIVVSLIIFVLQIQPLFDSTLLLDESFFANLLLPLITGARTVSLPNV